MNDNYTIYCMSLKSRFYWKGGIKLSIELQEARKELDILENLANNPQLILTDLFGGGTSELNFLYQVNIKGKYINMYLNIFFTFYHPIYNILTIL